ncbi:nuclear transport factor 2 family protein [Pseudohoeflea coraliihabitans]|uniref:Nuclear transport factor 2 family protein n=1 Tax=Pseudohoeflea coraliihabitans TaxID=2860393 RepID=A0ABS6WT92_9HYPH|nr:nuclear transport factor 2 family protein [Pseudohoeflea sp. DP4N28-3]MBW3099175.1 nuclear transport factor 2 family protein [Pseudohoeflea sp. DP4N28-3]
MKRAFALGLLAFAVLNWSPAQAGSAEKPSPRDVLERWYPALFSADRQELEPLLADTAEIRLEDLGITQTKTEFLDSLAEWKESVADATLDWKLDDTATHDSATDVTALVCYRFPSNELMTREAFEIEDDRITSSLQTSISDSCDGF